MRWMGTAGFPNRGGICFRLMRCILYFYTEGWGGERLGREKHKRASLLILLFASLWIPPMQPDTICRLVKDSAMAMVEVARFLPFLNRVSAEPPVRRPLPSLHFIARARDAQGSRAHPHFHSELEI